jgi:hypothetical protein
VSFTAFSAFSTVHSRRQLIGKAVQGLHYPLPSTAVESAELEMMGNCEPIWSERIEHENPFHGVLGRVDGLCLWWRTNGANLSPAARPAAYRYDRSSSAADARACTRSGAGAVAGAVAGPDSDI